MVFSKFTEKQFFTGYNISIICAFVLKCLGSNVYRYISFVIGNCYV